MLFFLFSRDEYKQSSNWEGAIKQVKIKTFEIVGL